MSGPDPTDTHTTQPIPTPTSSSSNVIPSALPPSLPRSASSPFMHLDVAKELESHSILQVLRHGHVGDEKNGEFRAVLGSGKASLFLPLASSLVHVAENVSSTFFEHHVFVRNPDNEMQLMSLGGIRALIKGQRLIIIGDRPTERELRGKRAGEMLSMWDTIDVETTTVDQYPSIELLSDTPLDVHLMDDASTAIKVHLMRRAIMHEDIAGPSQSVRTMDSKPPPTPPRPPPTYNTSLISLPTLGFDLTSVPSNVLTQIGAIPSLFGKSPSAATLLPRTTQPQQQHHQHHLAKVPALDADPQYVLFMTQMRDPRCQPLVAEINRYLVALTSSTTPVSSDEIAAYHAAFMHRVRTLVKESPAILTNTCADTKQVEQVLEGLDSYVLARGYPTYFVSILNEEQIADLIVHRKVSLLATVGFDLDSLGFPVVSAPDELRQTIKLAGIELLKAERAPTPRSKLAALVACHQKLASRMHLLFQSPPQPPQFSPTTESASTPSSSPRLPPTSLPSTPTSSQPPPPPPPPSSTLSSAAVDADALLPLLIYVVVRTNPPRLASTIKYIKTFGVANAAGSSDHHEREEQHDDGADAYCVTNLAAVLAFLETLDPSTLGLDDELLEAASAPQSSNYANDETLLILPTDHSRLLQLHDEHDHHHHRRQEQKQQQQQHQPHQQQQQQQQQQQMVHQQVLAGGAVVLDSIGRGISGMWPFRGAGGTAAAAAATPIPSPSGAAAASTPAAPDRLWARLKHHQG